MLLGTPLNQLAGVVNHVIFDREGDFRIEAELLLCSSDLFLAQCRTVDCTGVHHGWCWVADDGLDTNDGRAGGLCLRFFDCLEDCSDVFAGSDLKGLPAVGLVALHYVFGERDLGVVLDRDSVVVPEQDQVAQLLGASQRRCLRGNALLEAAVACNDINVVVEWGFARRGLRVKQATLTTSSHCHADSGSQTLAERTSGDFHVVGVVVLRVARGLGAPSAQRLQVIQFKPKPPR